MRLPLAITFPGLTPDPIVETEIRKRVAKLDAAVPRIIACHVVVDMPHRHRQRGNSFRIRIDLKIRREELAVARDGPYKEWRLVARELFDVARRRLQEHRRQRRDVKRRMVAARRVVAKRRTAA